MHAFRTYIFAKAYTLQRGLAAIAGLLVVLTITHASLIKTNVYVYHHIWL